MLALATLGACAGPYGPEVPNVPAEATGSLGLGGAPRAWCEEHGGSLNRFVDDQGRPAGTCVFPNGNSCDVQLVARGLCGPGVVGPAFGPRGRR
ncbi:MAG: DUF333 domain-containing protein [Alphaproteobacteria bacterium]|nr:DUF333 domain-containing protein [Alphaproteobacteria bacterium]